MTLRILIVEDEFFIAVDLQDQVEALGHSVTGVARDLESCKSAARQDRPDMAMMDLRLARGSSGIDASRWLYDTLGVRCIFISGNLDDATRQMLSVVEPLSFLGKPILKYQLARELERCCRELGNAADDMTPVRARWRSLTKRGRHGVDSGSGLAASGPQRVRRAARAGPMPGPRLDCL